MTRIREALPPGLVCHKRTRTFSARNVPWSLLKAHRTGAGVWGLLRVTRGRVRYCLDADPPLSLLVLEGREAVIEPQALHHVELLDADSTFLVELYRSETPR